MHNIRRIASRDYVPSQQDVLNTRVRTSGIVEERYTINSNKFLIVDVGGQRNERKKWIHSFEGVTAVLFVAAINEYDQMLFEDNTVSRITEAVKLFDDVCNNAFFKRTTMILFLNKRDLFEEKLFKIPLRVRGKRNDDFQGPYANAQGVSKRAAIDAATAYMTRQFTQVNRQPGRTVFAHVTCATDSDAVRLVFDACRDTILRENLSNFGFMDH
jgi:GTPase SAR1 family protein